MRALQWLAPDWPEAANNGSKRHRDRERERRGREREKERERERESVRERQDKKTEKR